MHTSAPSSRAPLRIGLTGGIGSGKSSVATLLASHGAVIVDTDAISRRLTGPGGLAIPALREAFGDQVIANNGALDRDRMRQRVFTNPDDRRQIEAILHPLISSEAEREATSHALAPVIVFDVPLLVESGRWIGRVDRVLVVDCSEQTQIERVMKRSGWSEDMVRSVIAAQATRDQRRAVADDLIVNDGISPAELDGRVAALWRTWSAREAGPL
ncbi:MAG: dephospho-CoA kinase [Burkholderiaceae bacterium]|nr:dephospho-CoA kinase [Burkholderiaceae bacterium]